MKNKKGFTLIELLAVIVILAIIALIATPVVLNIINSSKENANRNSVTFYGKAIDNAVKTYMASNNGKVPSGSYYSKGKMLYLKSDNTSKDIGIDYKGNDISCDIVIIYEDGEIYITECKIGNSEDYIYKEGSKTEYFVYGKKIYENGEVVYFDVDTGSKCTNYTETQSNTGVKSGCMKFYAFNDDGGDKLNLILDHHTTSTIAWNSSASNKNGPDEPFLNQLKNDTDSWNGTLTPENYTIDQSTQTSGAKYTIDYAGYKARIITAQEIAQITGNTSFNEITSGWENRFNFDTNTSTRSETCKEGNTIGCKYGWLYDRTYDCQTYGCDHSDSSALGYWTASPHAGDSIIAWCVFSFGLDGYNVDFAVDCGVRPVITVLKSNL